MESDSQNPWNGLAPRLKNNVVKLGLIIKDKLLEQLGDVSEKSVLELGCGTGYWGRNIKSGAYTGVDIDPGNIQAAKESDPLHTYGVMDATIPRTIGEFDIVLAAYLLVNISTPQGISKAIQSARLNLKPQGRLMVLDLGPEAIYSHSEYVSRTLNGNAKTGASFLTRLLICWRNLCIDRMQSPLDFRLQRVDIQFHLRLHPIPIFLSGFLPIILSTIAFRPDLLEKAPIEFEFGMPLADVREQTKMACWIDFVEPGDHIGELMQGVVVTVKHIIP